jgi:hypothetical protein
MIFSLRSNHEAGRVPEAKTMKITFRHSGSPVSSAKALVSKYPSDEFNSPERSTVPSLAYWMDAETRVSELCSQLRLVTPNRCTVEFEYQVAPAAGKGKKSHTDVMLWWGTTCIGIEAKYTEPPYEVVSLWLKKGSKPENRLKVLGGWCNLIEKTTRTHCAPESLGEETYQMIHRIASVCSRPEKQKHVVYQVFDPQPEKVEYYRQELARLKSVFATGSAICLHIGTVRMESSDIHKTLVEKWHRNPIPCGVDVVDGLTTGSLVSCRQMSIETI